MLIDFFSLLYTATVYSNVQSLIKIGIHLALSFDLRNSDEQKARLFKNHINQRLISINAKREIFRLID